jgi:hypothetical protein
MCDPFAKAILPWNKKEQDGDHLTAITIEASEHMDITSDMWFFCYGSRFESVK